MKPKSPDHVKTLTEIVGPGTWDTAQRMASEAITPEKKREFRSFLDFLSRRYPCEVCRSHIKKYITQNPITDYDSMRDSKGRDIGYAYYMWKFHNAVNKRLGKPHFEWEKFSAIYIYETEEIQCSSCKVATNSVINQDTQSQTSQSKSQTKKSIKFRIG